MSKRATCIGFSDPRTKAGDLLWPAQFGPVALAKLESDLGAFGVAGQLQQRPSPEIGGMFKRHWWKFWKPAGSRLAAVPVKQPDGTIRMYEPVELPPFDEELHSWDMSYRDLKESDFVVGTHWARSGANKYLLHLVKGQWEFSRTLKEFKAFVEAYPVPAKLVENAANGPAIIYSVQESIPGVIAVVPLGNKESRAAACSPQVEAGNVFLPHPALPGADWVAAFIDECAQFPAGMHDDQVDAMSQALARMSQGAVYRLLPEFRSHRAGNEPAEACHVSRGQNLQLEAWWPRWVSVGSVPGGGTAIHWYCQKPSGQVHIYRERFCDGTAEEAGVALADGSSTEVEHTQRLTAFLAQDLFHESVADKSFAAELVKGIDKVVGRDATFTFAYTDDERRMPDAQAWLSLKSREAKAHQARILVRSVEGARQGGWEHIRGMLRWWPITQPETIPYDRATARRILEEDGQAAMDEYLRHVHGVDHTGEDLPGLLIWERCDLLIRYLAAAVKDEKKLDTATPSPLAESVLAGLMGQREHAEIRPPQEAFTAARLDQLRARVPNPNAQQIFMASQQAEADWKKKYSTPRKGFTFSRLPRRGRL